MRIRTLPATLALILATMAAAPGMAQDAPEETQLAALDAETGSHDARTLADLDLSLNAQARAASATPETSSPLPGNAVGPETGSVTTELSSEVTLEGVYRLIISR